MGFVVDLGARQLRRQCLAFGLGKRLVFRQRATQLHQFLFYCGQVCIHGIIEQATLFARQPLALLAVAVTPQDRNLVRQLPDARFLVQIVLAQPFHLLLSFLQRDISLRQLAHHLAHQPPQGISIQLIEVGHRQLSHSANDAMQHPFAPLAMLRIAPYNRLRPDGSRRCHGRPTTKALA
ncbi:hypothetical protein KESI111651_17205 [Kerstersia similis]